MTRKILAGLSITGLERIYQQLDPSLGVVLTFHRVQPGANDIRIPNAHLSIEPDFLAGVIQLLRRRGFEIVSLDELKRGIENPIAERRMAALTFDDGFKDNLQHALPILEAEAAPATVFSAPGLIEGTAALWWEGLGALVMQQDYFTFTGEKGPVAFDCTTPSRKEECFQSLVEYLVFRVPEEQMQTRVAELCWLYKIDVDEITREAIMTWDELRQMAASPYITIGAHTMNHVHLARLPEETAREEIQQSALVLEAELGRRPRHLAYPYGYPHAAAKREFDLAKDLRFDVAVTTRPGMLFEDHRDHMTALPRISVNGLYQKNRYFAPLTSGLPSLLANGFSRLNVA
ncbi:MAG: polysaccharide deacetylase family protein [Pseudomonadota bacterium]